MGHSVTCANDGLAAIRTLCEGDFDCIFMDIQMPEMNGVQATKAIRSMTELGKKSKIPIIALTAYAMTGDREKFLEAGMDLCTTGGGEVSSTVTGPKSLLTG